MGGKQSGALPPTPVCLWGAPQLFAHADEGCGEALLMQKRQASAACGWAWGLPGLSVPLFPGRVKRGPALPFLFPGRSVGSYIFISKS